MYTVQTQTVIMQIVDTFVHVQQQGNVCNCCACKMLFYECKVLCYSYRVILDGCIARIMYVSEGPNPRMHFTTGLLLSQSFTSVHCVLRNRLRTASLPAIQCTLHIVATLDHALLPTVCKCPPSI